MLCFPKGVLPPPLANQIDIKDSQSGADHWVLTFSYETLSLLKIADSLRPTDSGNP